MAIKRCKSSFAAAVRGVPRVMAVGTLVDEDDPILKGREDLFEDVELHVQGRASRVEQATAEPGARRSLGRPLAKRAAAKKAADKPKPDTKAADGPGPDAGDKQEGANAS